MVVDRGGAAPGSVGARSPRLTPALPIASCRGVGCIHYEMATGRPLFPGSTVKEELHLIFRLLGQSPAAPSVSPRGGTSTPSSMDASWVGQDPPGWGSRWPRPLSAPTSSLAPHPMSPSALASHPPKPFSSPQGPPRKRRGPGSWPCPSSEPTTSPGTSHSRSSAMLPGSLSSPLLSAVVLTVPRGSGLGAHHTPTGLH